MSSKNRRHIVVGMNVDLVEPSAIPRPYVDKLRESLDCSLELGTVLSFDVKTRPEMGFCQRLHAVVCHTVHRIGRGWNGADRHVRFALDYLHYTERHTGEFSIVRIGTGPVGLRDGADHAAILTAMNNSFLPLTLYIRPEESLRPVAVEMAPLELVALASAWHPDKGRHEFAHAA
jgi:hypothetical protein